MGGLSYLVLVPCTWYACFSHDDPWYLVSRPINKTKLRELRTAMGTSREGCRCYLGASRDPVRFEIGVAFVAMYVSYDRRIRATPIDTTSAKFKSGNCAAAVEQSSHESLWPRRQARRKDELHHANLRRMKTVPGMPA